MYFCIYRLANTIGLLVTNYESPILIVLRSTYRNRLADETNETAGYLIILSDEKLRNDEKIFSNL